MPRTFLVEQKQPFGEVHESTMLPGSPVDQGYHKQQALSNANQEVPNHHKDMVHSFADQGAGALSYASRNASNPFAPTGHPK